MRVNPLYSISNLVITVFGFWWAGIVPSSANPGILDDTFGTDGRVITGFGAGDDDDANAVAIQTDGKILVAGSTRAGSNNNFALARYNTDGSLDTNFGTGGKVTTDFFGDYDYATSIAVLTGGKILVAGGAYNPPNNNIALARYTSTGALDTSFDTDGLVTINFGRAASSMAVQSDGKIVVAGQDFSGVNGAFAVARLNADGSLDTSFSGDGKVTTNLGGRRERANSLAIQSDGKIVVVGDTDDDGATDWDIGVVRYNTDGSLDTSFDSDGIVKTDFGNTPEFGESVAVQGDGKIIVAGRTGTTNDFALVRYNTDGSLDTSFSGDGKVTTNFFGNPDVALSVILQPDGKIIAGGYTDRANDVHDFALARYNTDGSLDPQFGKGGKINTDFAGNDENGRALALQGDGKILLAGLSEDGTSQDFALARYGADYQPDNIINSKGNNTYNTSGAGQTHNLVSKKARTVRATLVIQNDGVKADSFMLRGTKGNNFFKVTFTSNGGNVTGQVTAGTFTTPALNAGDTHIVKVTIKPIRSKLLKKTKKGKVWLKKSRTLVLSSTSQADATKKDTAKIKVTHK